MLVPLSAALAFFAWRRATDPAAHREDIYEAVILHVAHNSYPDAIGKWTFFVSVEWNDPSEALLRRLNEGGLTVKPWSEGVKTKSEGVWIPVFRFRRTGPASAEVNWQYNYGPMAAAEFTCTVVRARGGWIVRDERRLWVS